MEKEIWIIDKSSIVTLFQLELDFFNKNFLQIYPYQLLYCSTLICFFARTSRTIYNELQNIRNMLLLIPAPKKTTLIAN